jgi:DNA-3-methyladenine glycosylase
VHANDAWPLGPSGSRVKLERDFYLQPAMDCVTKFLGKVLVRQTDSGRRAGVICDVEAYPAFVDQVHHGNTRTDRTSIMWESGGFAYVYLIYGVWHQFAAVVNDEGIPDVVFIRGVVPVEGIQQMAAEWTKPRATSTLANSPGKLCKSFAITKEHYGSDLAGDGLFLEDWAMHVDPAQVRTSKRVGIATRHDGYDTPLRYHLDAKETKDSR